MEDKLVFDFTDIARLTDIKVVKKHISKEGKSKELAVDLELTNHIKRLKGMIELLSDIESHIKDNILTLSTKYNSTKLLGDGLTVSLRPLVKYEVLAGYKREWATAKITYPPNTEKIDAYVLLHGNVPEGVRKTSEKKIVQFTIKKS